MSGRITFEIDETAFVREDNTKQLMEKYKTEVLIIKQADATTTMELFVSIVPVLFSIHTFSHLIY
jgi:hypothetical protein